MSLQRVAKCVEVLARLRIEVIGQQRRARDDCLHLRILAVENAQRIAFETPLAVGVEA